MTDQPTSHVPVINLDTLKDILVGWGFRDQAEPMAERMMLAAEESDELRGMLPATAVRWHSGTEDGPSLTVEWRDKPSPGEVAILVELLARLNPVEIPAYKLTVSGDGRGAAG